MQDPRFASLVRQLDPAARLERVSTLGGGIAAETDAVEWLDAVGSRNTVVVRRIGASGKSTDYLTAAEQYTLLRALHGTGLPVPEPLLLDESRRNFAEPFLVLRHIAGKPELTPRDRFEFARTLASQLADVHERARSALADCEFLPRAPEFAAARLARAPFESRATYPQAAVRGALSRVWPLAQRNPDCLLHGDYWAGNLIWNEGVLCGVIDWADALIGDPLADVSIARLDLLWLLDADTMQEFTNAYFAASRYDAEQLPYWDLFTTLRPGGNLAHWASAWPVLGRPDITEHVMADAREVFAARAFEALAK